MDNKKKNILLGILIVGVISMTIAFAALTTRLKISGTTNTTAVSWNIHFQEWQKVAVVEGLNGNTNTASSPEVSQLTMQDNSNVTKVSNINVTLNQPGDIAKYTFQIINEGTIDAKLDNFTVTDTSNNNLVGYEVKCYESSTLTGNEVTQNSVLTANGGLAYCYLQIIYKDQINSHTAGSNQIYHQEQISTNLAAQWTWIQDGVSANNNQGGGSEPTPQLTGNWDNYITPSQASGSTLPQDVKTWIQQNTVTGEQEVCGRFPNGDVCMERASEGRHSDFDVGCQATDGSCTLTENGYALQKKNEMIEKGATVCSVYKNYFECSHPDTYITCQILSSGTIACYNRNHNCFINESEIPYCG